MANIMYFKDMIEFDYYFRNRASKKIGEGTEGVCYVGNFDALVYKKFTQRFTNMNYDISKIITTDDIKLDSFAFPETLFVCNGELLGYTTRYIAPNYFNDRYTYSTDNLMRLDFQKLKVAYNLMREDLVHLSQKRIHIYDLAYNLMFDGRNLVAVDTCNYERVNRSVYQENIESLDYALKTLFDLWTRKDERFQLDSSLEIDKYILTLERTVRKLRKY